MKTSYDAMEQCMSRSAPVDVLLAALQGEDWQARFTAAVALGDRRERAAVGAMIEVLTAEDPAPLYTQQADLGGIPAGSPHGRAPVFPPGTPEATRTAWARRGRIKQAICLALGEIGVADPRALEFLHRYATDQGEDYAVRAAANKALGLLKHPSSRPVLERAVTDPEWCTQTEARKALAALG